MRDGYQPKGRGPIGPPPTGGSSARHPADVAWRQQVAAWLAATEHRCYWMEQCERVQSAGFAPEDYASTAKLMRQHTADASPKLFQAVCSNNLNIILAALDAMGDEP